MRCGGCWSATSCHTTRGMDTISTLPGGVSSAAPAVAGIRATRGADGRQCDRPRPGARARRRAGHRSAEEVPVQLLGGVDEGVGAQDPLHRDVPGLGHLRGGRRVGQQASHRVGQGPGVADRDDPATRRLPGPLPGPARPAWPPPAGRSTSASASTSGPDSQTEGMATTSAAASSSGALSLGPTRVTVDSSRLARIRLVQLTGHRALADDRPPAAARVAPPAGRRPRSASGAPSADGAVRRRRRAPGLRRRRAGSEPPRGSDVPRVLDRAAGSPGPAREVCCAT